MNYTLKKKENQIDTMNRPHFQINCTRHLATAFKPNKDPFVEIGLGKHKGTSKSVCAWGQSATGAIGNIKYFAYQTNKYEQILKPYRIRYFMNMNVSSMIFLGSIPLLTYISYDIVLMSIG